MGKSTAAANLAAYFDRLNVRVLLIDFDYQGSLTDMVVSGEELPFGANELMEPACTPERLLKSCVKLTDPFHSTDLLAAFYTLSRAESRAVFNWLVKETRRDIRYNTHRILSSRLIRTRYDLVIIDAPPRLMTASINALCASTHVLVPSILDNISCSAALTTIDTILKIKKTLSPSLEIIGVVPTFVNQSTGFKPSEKHALDFLSTEISTRYSDMQEPPIQVLRDQRLLRRASIANVAGDKVAFFDDAEIELMYSKLAERLAKRFGVEFLRKVTDEREGPSDRSARISDNVMQMGA